MKFGEKLSRMRKDRNYTQEQFADILGVSRQTVSKWESDIAFPETEKLIRISEMFDCSIDYLLKESIEEPQGTNAKQDDFTGGNDTVIHTGAAIRERKSKKTVFGMPLWHIGRKACGFIAIGLNAKGVIAIGLAARGIISIGLLSVGIFSLGVLALGLLACGTFSLGLFAFGAVCAGIVSGGAICAGIVSMGAIAGGDFAVGALVRGKYFALGDDVRAMIALGLNEDSEVAGSVYSAVCEWDTEQVKRLLDEIVPPYLNWAKKIAEIFLR